eukprot:TRINITY_DN4533_c0_g1_i4.p1 TRINITY_DN4533_c0_g1~~TRINITY_DN4533_c0_g1_i4.p1  ORF type:complete len:320 (-),score=24.55 TRINITY_DN4533_c0_g1_i4:124-1083(-)
MAHSVGFSRSAFLWRSIAMAVEVRLLTGLPLAARRSTAPYRSWSNSTYLCGANSVGSFRGCKCLQGFRCVVVGSSNSCLYRGNVVLGWNHRVASYNKYVPEFCMDAYSAPCECRREPSRVELAMRATDDGRVIAATDDSAAFWETYFSSNRGSPVPPAGTAANDDSAEFWSRNLNRNRGSPVTPGGPSGSSQARVDAADVRTSESSVVSSLRPIEVDEDLVRAHLSCLPSSLRDEMISSITCPISLSLMRDPVVAADGNTYDRESIMRAFRAKAAGQPIRGISGDIYSRTVVENLNVRRILAEFERLGNAEKERQDDAK